MIIEIKKIVNEYQKEDEKNTFDVFFKNLNFEKHLKDGKLHQRSFLI